MFRQKVTCGSPQSVASGVLSEFRLCILGATMKTFVLHDYDRLKEFPRRHGSSASAFKGPLGDLFKLVFVLCIDFKLISSVEFIYMYTYISILG